MLITLHIKMPCACQLPPEIYPDASEWGPILWTILHGMAERVGSTPFPQYQNDERRALIKVMKTLEKVIPCPSCKEHYEVYLKEHPVDKTIMDISYTNLNSYVKTWFWELHNWVNESLGRAQFPYEDLTPTYKSVNLRLQMKVLDTPMRKAIRIRAGQLLGYTEFIKQSLTLFSIWGL
jgi:Erv1 / Alr family